ncbi:hypothetical protein [Sphingosinithalassobacter portus]|uniref:hypothetical protein n=1 Tax=Stakelama portus TaxID=2676234 RepID=UPI000D6E7AB3|nr:hypothetical protein [Sphingosinithalassobacter portus]
MLAALVLLQAVPAAAPVFAPPTDAALHVTIRRVETDGEDRRIYTAERRIRFAREESGYRADVTVLAATGESTGMEGALYEAGYRFLIGRTIVIHLNAGGEAVAVDDLDSLWDAFCRGIAERYATTRGVVESEARDRFIAQVAATLMGWPEERRIHTFGSMVTAIAAPGPFAVPGTTEPVTIPGRGPSGESVTLSGTVETREQGPLLYVVTSASGSVPATQATRVSQREARVIDPATGLIRRSEAWSQTETGAGAERHIVTAETALTVAPES